jgi:Protein of unknown function (DUF2877)
MKKITSQKFGYRAYEEAQLAQNAELMGVTSRGIFLRTDSNHIIFITTEKYYNPLNVIFQSIPNRLTEITKDDPVILGNGEIFFSKLDIMIHLPDENIQRTPSISPGISRPILLIEHLEAIIAELSSRIKPEGFAAILRAIVFPDLQNHLSDPNLEKLNGIRTALQSLDLDGVERGLVTFLGSGRGLTPSGDDLVYGFLLATNRWNPHKIENHSLQTLNQFMVARAYTTTTTLSANLIELSVSGDGDERLIIALDSFFTGEPPPSEVAKLLLAYGSSSGVDALTGMVAAI